ncbi:MAG: CCA tRNA nucleotidyltransferase [Erysipelotrichaceae bacterium]|nr:CCA tRNA nucleotidyltransferase [Erysipelotrichaceae bacterium]
MNTIVTLPAEILRLIGKLNEAGYEAYAVGGCVRDALLKRPTHDYDLTTDALPEEIHRIFQNEHIIDTGIKHGTVTVITGSIPVEITTYRTESAYHDHRHPDRVSFTRSLKEDCARRDFTINAMAYHPETGIVDWFHGMNDLQAKVIRSVNDPRERFNEDALRILRAVRFAAQLGFRIEEKTAQAVLDMKQDLQYISAERIEAELQKLLLSDSPASVLDPYRPLLEVILPQLKDDAAWDETMLRIDRSEGLYAARLAVLCADVPLTAADLQKLKVTNTVRDTVLAIRQYRELPFETRADLRKAMYLLDRAYPDYLVYRCAVDKHSGTERLKELSDRIIRDSDVIRLSQLAVNGQDLLDLGYRGKEIADTLQKLLYAVMEDTVSNTRDALLGTIKER